MEGLLAAPVAVVDVVAALDAPTVSLSLGWYRQTLFDTYHEVHAVQLGLYAGVLVAALRARGYRHVPTALTLALLAFAFGFPDVYAVCHRTGEACGSLAVQTQPWYFLTGLLATGVVGPRVVRRSRRGLRRWRSGGPVPRARDAEGTREPVASTDGGRPRRSSRRTDPGHAPDE